MSTRKDIIQVEVIERELVNIDFVEKELVKIEMESIDVLFRQDAHLDDLQDVTVATPIAGHMLLYDESSSTFINQHFSTVLGNWTVLNETPTGVTSRQFRTANAYLAGTLQVFINGIKHNQITEDSDILFSLDFDFDFGDLIQVNYIKKA